MKNIHTNYYIYNIIYKTYIFTIFTILKIKYLCKFLCLLLITRQYQFIKLLRKISTYNPELNKQSLYFFLFRYSKKKIKSYKNTYYKIIILDKNNNLYVLIYLYVIPNN